MSAESKKSKTAVRAGLSRREREIVDILYRLKRATVAEVQGALPGDANYSTVRAQLRVLEEKGHVRHEEDGPRYVYAPNVPKERASQSALRHVLDTFFDGSAEKAVGALLSGNASKLRGEELDRIAKLIEQAKKEAGK